ncbi:TIGR03032 family protein [Sphingomonas sp. So64.6b]|uniref:TIGR03032 family protein n=1 Tax=Sphingomonas sp. So64.6b TaxID=2997354 RepID=UPI001FCE9865|nr:TIGR03032 family protein [Sphingomonas sp. So64.6b]
MSKKPIASATENMPPPSGPAGGAAKAKTAAAPASKQPNTNISVSRGFADWLRANKLSFAFTSYQTGQLFLVGVTPAGTVSFNQQNFTRAMGVCYQPGRLYLGALHQVWRLENVLRPGELGNKSFDMVLVPRNAQTTGDVDVHEVGTDSAGRVIFVNTKYSCLATLDLNHSFRPIWKPKFISKLAPEDRCHLNGMAMDNGKPRYVTAVSRSDILTGWRERRHEGGVLIEVETDRVVTDQLSMPHSPRVYGDSVLALDSGRGQIIRIDPKTGDRTDIAFCPGFLRGMSIHNGHALVTVSKPRNGTFAGLALDDAMKERDAEPWCGVLVVNLATGDIVEWVKLEGFITELFDVAAMPSVVCPMSIGPDTLEIRSTITFDPVITKA